MQLSGQHPGRPHVEAGWRESAASGRHAFCFLERGVQEGEAEAVNGCSLLSLSRRSWLAELGKTSRGRWHVDLQEWMGLDMQSWGKCILGRGNSLSKGRAGTVGELLSGRSMGEGRWVRTEIGWGGHCARL